MDIESQAVSLTGDSLAFSLDGVLPSRMRIPQCGWAASEDALCSVAQPFTTFVLETRKESSNDITTDHP